MKRLVLFFLLTLGCGAPVAFGQNPFAGHPLYAKVDSLLRLGQPRAALPYLQALKQVAERNQAQQPGAYLWAMVHETRLKISLGGSENINQVLLDLIAEWHSTQPPIRNVMASWLADIFAEQAKRGLDIRNVHDSLPNPNDIARWSRFDYFQYAKWLHYQSCAGLDSLPSGAMDPAPFAPFITPADSGFAPLRPTLYDVLANRALTSNYDDLSKELRLFSQNIDYFRPLFNFTPTFYDSIPHTGGVLPAVDKHWQLRWRLSRFHFIRMAQGLEGPEALALLDFNRLMNINLITNSHTELDARRNEVVMQFQADFWQAYQNSSMAGVVAILMSENWETLSDNAENVYHYGSGNYNREWNSQYDETSILTISHFAKTNEASKRDKYLQAANMWAERAQVHSNLMQPYWAQRLQRLQMRINAPDIRLKSEGILTPGQSALVQVRLRNVEKIQWRVVQVGSNQWNGMKTVIELQNYNRSHFVDSLSNVLAQLPAFANWESVLPRVEAHSTHFSEISMPELPAGHYILMATSGDTVRGFSQTVAMVAFRCSQIAMLQTNNHSTQAGTENEVFFIDRNANGPLQNVTLQVQEVSRKHHYEPDTGRNRRSVYITDTTTQLVQSDANGRLVYRIDNEEEANEDISIIQSAWLPGDTLFSISTKYVDSPFRNTYRESQRDALRRISVVTDRTLYRPGSTVHFKATVIEHKKSGTIRLMPNELFYLQLVGPNGHEVGPICTLRTNALGSVADSIVLPAQCPTGVFGFEIPLDWEYEEQFDGDWDDPEYEFRVEEYRLPRFEAFWDTEQPPCRLQDTVTVWGQAEWYAGGGVNGAVAVYVVYEGFRYQYSNSNAPPMVSDTVRLDANGRFRVQFLPQNTEGVNSKDYTLEVRIVEPGGESFSLSRTISVMKTSVRLSSEMSKLISNAHYQFLSFTLTQGNQKRVAGQVGVWAHRLQAPSQALRTPQWGLPTVPYLADSEYQRLFPNRIRGNEYDYTQWPIADTVSALLVPADTVLGWHPGVRVQLLQHQPPGIYRVVAMGRDHFGTPVWDTTYVHLTAPTAPPHPPIRLLWVQWDSLTNTFRSGETATVWASAAQPGTRALLRIAQPGRTENRWVTLGPTAQKFTFRVVNETRGMIDVQVITMWQGAEQLAKIRGWVHAPRPHRPERQINPRLQPILYLSTFRQRMQPGQPERWELTLSGLSRGERAEAWARMYDIAMDAAYPSRYSLYRINEDFRGRNSYSYPEGYYDPYSLLAPSLSVSNGQQVVNGSQITRWRGGRYPTTRLPRYNRFGPLSWPDLVLNPNSSPLPSDLFAIIGEGGLIRADETVTGGSFSMEQIIDNPARGVAAMASTTAGVYRTDGGDLNVRGGRAEGTEVFVDGVRVIGSAAVPHASISSVDNFQTDQSGSYDFGLEGEQQDDTTTRTESIPQPLRRNLSPTCIWAPQIQFDRRGLGQISFTTTEALTRWRFEALAHTSRRRTAEFMFDQFRTQKTLMVMPNPPRVLRHGDTIWFSARVVSLDSTHAAAGTVRLRLLDAETLRPVDGLLGNTTPEQPFSVSPGGTQVVFWRLAVPSGSAAPAGITYQVVAQTPTHSDGEENTLPVLPNWVLVTEAQPFVLNGTGYTVLGFNGIDQLDTTRTRPHALRVEANARPTWLAVQALGYLSDFPHECAEQLASRLYANVLSGLLVRNTPGLSRKLEEWQMADTVAASPLLRNPELRNVHLEETPWLRDAQNEEDRRRQLYQLLDFERNEESWKASFAKLMEYQLPDGAFPWFPGMRGDDFITQQIVLYAMRLKRMGFTSSLFTGSWQDFDQWQTAINQANQYLAFAFTQRHKKMMQLPDSLHRPTYSDLLFVYGSSFDKQFWNLTMHSTEVRAALATYHKLWVNSWQQMPPTQQAMLALILARQAQHQNRGSDSVATAILASLSDRLIRHPERGATMPLSADWVFNRSSEIEKQSLLTEAFDELAHDKLTVSQLRLALLRLRHTHHWGTTVATAQAVYALLSTDSLRMATATALQVQIGQRVMPMPALNTVTGLTAHTVAGPDIRREMANIIVRSEEPGPVFGAVYWQYFQSADIQAETDSDLSVRKEIYVQRAVNGQPGWVRVQDTTTLQPGDVLRVRLFIRANQSLEYIHLKDIRAAGLEPVSQLSGYRWAGGLAFYEAPRDAATHFYLQRLATGTHVLEYDLRAVHSGTFSAGNATVQCMYAPEFVGHSTGMRLTVNP